MVRFDTPPALCRRRNAERDRPVPARVLADQLRSCTHVAAALDAEGWDRVVTVTTADDPPTPAAQPGRQDRRSIAPAGLEVVLQVSRFPWGEDPARLADGRSRWPPTRPGFAGIALMDHLIQIPQVGTAWEPIPEPWVTLGMLAGLDTALRLGTLVTPVTFRPPGITAKTVATLDAISGGRAFCGVGAGWWEREHPAFGLPFPPPAERLDLLETAIETMRALWAPGTKAYDGQRVALPETTCYPRPVARRPGHRRRRWRASYPADRRAPRRRLQRPGRPRSTAKTDVLRRHCAEVGRDPAEVAVTVLDLPVVGRDRDDVWERVERLRGRTAAATYARRHHAGTPPSTGSATGSWPSRGVSTVFVALPDLTRPEELLDLAPLVP